MKNCLKLNICVYVISALLLCWPFPGVASAQAEVGVDGRTIYLGSSNAQSGPAQELGQGMSRGLNLYFNKVNQQGGVHGRQIKLIQMDDQYDVKRVIENTQELVAHRNVFALVGYVGTPTARAIIPKISRENIPFLAPYTGAKFLRSPPLPMVFNTRASYMDEMELIVHELVDGRKFKRIGLFMQNDSYGLSGESALKEALKKRGLEIVQTGTYERNTEDVDAAFQELRKASPDAVIMVGTYKACAVFLQKAREAQMRSVFYNISFVGTGSLIANAKAAAEDVYITQVFPDPLTSDLPVIVQYRADMIAAGLADKMDYPSLEGYIDAVLLIKALEATGPNLTRARFVETLNHFKADLGGLDFQFTPDHHQASDRVYLTQISQGKAKPVTVNTDHKEPDHKDFDHKDSKQSDSKQSDSGQKESAKENSLDSKP